METYVIHVTKECNMDCFYCYEKDKKSIYTWEDVKKFIDNLIEYRTSDSFMIEFLGGEPMLRWDLIQQSYEYIEIEYPMLNVESYVITTNGTILPDVVIDYLSKNRKITYAISMDGTKNSNQFRVMKDSRKNSYDLVVDNINRLRIAGISFGVHVVSHLYNVCDLSKNIKHLYDLGVRNIGIGTIESTMTIDQNYCDRFISEVKIVANCMINGEFPGLVIDLFDHLKSYDDVRSYIYDESGKTIGETYGRSGSDITHTDVYATKRCTEHSSVSEMIYYIRKTSYDYYHSLK